MMHFFPSTESKAWHIFYADSESRVVWSFQYANLSHLTYLTTVLKLVSALVGNVSQADRHLDRTVSPGKASLCGAEPLKWLTGTSKQSSWYKEQHLMDFHYP